MKRESDLTGTRREGYQGTEHAPEQGDTAAHGQPIARLFLREVLLSEHVILLAVGWYSLWAAKESDSHMVLARRLAGGMYTVAVGISFLAALVLAALLLRFRLATW